MSYCVNCGVELDDSARRCALCSTPVCNPNTLAVPYEPPYPDRIVIPEAKKRTFMTLVISVILLLPSPVCLIINAFLTPHDRWSAYVVASGILVWIVCLLPFLFNKKRPYLLLCLDALVIGGYGLTFYYLVNSGSWFFNIFLPLDALFVLTGLFLIRCLRRRRRSTVYIATVILCAVALFSGGTGIIFRISLPNLLTDCITLSISVSSVILTLLLVIASKNPDFRAWLERKSYM